MKTNLGQRTLSLLSASVSLMAGFAAAAAALLMGPRPGRSFTKDVAFGFRMAVGFPGDVNRTHPFSILPGLISATQAVRRYGDPCLYDAANGYRGIVAGDQSNATAVAIASAIVRAYPTQQSSGGMSASIGAATPPTAGVADFLREGYMMAQLPAGQTVIKGQAVWIWAVATSGAHIQGGFESLASAGNTVPVSNARFTGPPDATGVVEIEIWAA
jgi:hypothetical protein